VRVLISENQKLMRLTVKGECVIRVLPSMELVKRGSKLNQIAITPTPKGIKVGGAEFIGRGLRIEPKVDRDLYLDGSRFRGFVDVLKNSSNSLYAINTLNIEKYLYGVLHHEVAPWWPMEALKAQAIAARTYAVYQIQVSKPQEYDVKSGTSSQVYGGSTTERSRSKRAVDGTKGKILSFGGKVFPAYFHATCAGITAAAQELWKIDVAPLKGGVACGFCRISPHFEWQSKVPLASIEERMNKNGRPVGRILKLELISKTPSGRVGSLRITGTGGDTVMAAKDFRIWIGGDKIRSTNFTVVIQEDLAWCGSLPVGNAGPGAFRQKLSEHSAILLSRFADHNL
jgi:stage II sporulation protein D